MENLFDFAPKELTQDGFIRWLLSSWEDSGLREVAADFVLFLTDGKVNIKDGQIRKLKTHAQVAYMDVLCDFFFGNSEKKSNFLLVIEDKTTSAEHDNQLRRYNETLCKWEGLDTKDTDKLKERKRIIRTYYKTTPIADWERDVASKEGWRVFELKEIASFWKKYEGHENIIVKFYAEHIRKIYESSLMETKPDKNDVIAWLSFYQKTLVPKLSDALGDTVKIWFGSNQYGYAFLCLEPLGISNCPYFEIRSRDNTQDELIVRILRYGRENTADEVESFRQIVSSDVTSQFKTSSSGKRDKQLAVAKIALMSKELDEFIDVLITSAERYLFYVEEWREKRTS